MMLNGRYFDNRAEAYFGRNGMIKVTGDHTPTISEIMRDNKNVQRTKEYMKLKHSIESCTNAAQLAQLSESVIKYHKDKKQDSGELLAVFVEKEDTLSVE